MDVYATCKRQKKTIGLIQIWSHHWEHDTARRQTKQKLHHG